VPWSYALAMLLLAACGMVQQDEVARVRSPSGNVDAVLIESNGGATTSYGYTVYVVPAGAEADKAGRVVNLEGAGRNDQASGANLRWTGPSYLRVEFLSAEQAQVVRARLDIGNETVVVSLRDSIVDPDAPAGGMAAARPRTRQ
jgi:hypothetical protein